MRDNPCDFNLLPKSPESYWLDFSYLDGLMLSADVSLGEEDFEPEQKDPEPEDEQDSLFKARKEDL